MNVSKVRHQAKMSGSERGDLRLKSIMIQRSECANEERGPTNVGNLQRTTKVKEEAAGTRRMTSSRREYDQVSTLNLKVFKDGKGYI